MRNSFGADFEFDAIRSVQLDAKAVPPRRHNGVYTCDASSLRPRIGEVSWLDSNGIT
jgi:hypothetical protein